MINKPGEDICLSLFYYSRSSCVSSYIFYIFLHFQNLLYNSNISSMFIKYNLPFLFEYKGLSLFSYYQTG